MRRLCQRSRLALSPVLLRRSGIMAAQGTTSDVFRMCSGSSSGLCYIRISAERPEAVSEPEHTYVRRRRPG